MPTALPDLADITTVMAVLGPGADQGRVQELLSLASARFRGAVRHPVTLVEDDQVTLDGTGKATLLLPAAPVVAVTEVLVDGDPIDDFEWSTAGMLRRRGRWPDRLGAIQVTYNHGYDPVPDDIAEAVINQVRYMNRAEPGVSAMQVGGQSLSWSGTAAEGVTALWSSVVEAYRLNRGDRA